jgi:hypothetical protein
MNMEIGNEAAQIPFLEVGTHNSYLLCSAPLPHSHDRTPYLMPQLSYFIMQHLRFFFISAQFWYPAGRASDAAS